MSGALERSWIINCESYALRGIREAAIQGLAVAVLKPN